jgi:polysaccharide export outer membrane protein/exopolysaccharide production protein ExoF
MTDIDRLRRSIADARNAALFRRTRLCLLTLALALVASLLQSSTIAAGPTETGNEYILGPQDRIRLKVLEWRASRDEVFEWSALNAEYAISAGGQLSLPIIGEVVAGGKTPKELAVAIGVALKEHVGFIEAKHIAVEVMQYRPFYVYGIIERPGEYAFRPGLTVLQALTLAGGASRLGEAGSVRLAREIIASKGDISLLRMEYASGVARKARLMAELDELSDIAKPEENDSRLEDSSLQDALYLEGLLFHSRKDGFHAQIGVLGQLQGSLENESSSLSAQLVVHDKQIQLLNEELQAVATLYNKQLTTAPRKLALERNAAQLQGERIRLETSIARANQEVRKTELSILELKSRRLNEITSDLRQTQSKLEETGRRLATAESLFYESEIVAARTMALNAQDQTRPLYTIVRRRLGQTLDIPANENTFIEPGDTLKIELPAATSNGILEAAKDSRADVSPRRTNSIRAQRSTPEQADHTPSQGLMR